jgi:hypothetical protein
LASWDRWRRVVWRDRSGVVVGFDDQAFYIHIVSSLGCV